MRGRPHTVEVPCRRRSEPRRRIHGRWATQWNLALTGPDAPERYLDLLPPGFSCVSTLSLSFLANDHAVHYIPIEYRPRAGRSKFHPLRDTYLYVLQVLRMITYFEPLRIYGPAALVLLGLSTAKLTYDLIVHPFRVANITMLLFFAAFNALALGLLADLSSKGLMNRRRDEI